MAFTDTKQRLMQERYDQFQCITMSIHEVFLEAGEGEITRAWADDVANAMTGNVADIVFPHGLQPALRYAVGRIVCVKKLRHFGSHPTLLIRPTRVDMLDEHSRIRRSTQSFRCDLYPPNFSLGASEFKRVYVGGRIETS